jgi:GNAT superfamily N-acetyltransferase
VGLWRIRATVDDRPGYLSVLTAGLALRSVNILAVQVHTTEAGAVDDFLVDAPDTMTEAELLAAVAKGRGRDAFVVPAEARGLADQPTRALALAARLVRDPDALGDALAALLEAAEVGWRPDAGAYGLAGGRMTLADPAGGTYDVVRGRPPFTPAEYARAQALAEVAGAVLGRHAERSSLLLPDGAELLVRAASADDAGAVRALHARCSAESLRRRYPGGPPSEARLRRVLEPPGGLTLLAVDAADGAAVAVATLLAEGDLGEVAVLVADGRQRRGVGTALLRRLVAYARRTGFVALAAHAGADNAAVLRTLRRLGAREPTRDGAMLTVTLPVDRRPAGERVTGPAPRPAGP